MTWARDISRLAVLRLMLALVIVLQAGLSASAMARMDAGRLSADSQQFELVICTPDGIKTVKLPSGSEQPHGHADCECPCATLCAAFSAAGLASEVRNYGSPGADLAGQPLWVALEAMLPDLRAGARPGSPRAPPLPA
jgi:hypothetical protein